MLKTVEQLKSELLPQPKDIKKGWQRGEELGVSKDWLFNSAKQLFKWAVGEEMTEEQFKQCLKEASEHYVR